MSPPPSQPSSAALPSDEWMYLNPSAAIMHLAAGGLFAGALAAAITLAIAQPNEPVRLLGPLQVFFIACLAEVFVLSGRHRVGLLVLILGSLLVVTLTATLTGGVHAPIVVAFPPIVLLIGWVLKPRPVLAVAAFVIAVTTALTVAGSRGLLPTPPPAITALHGVVQIIVILLAAVMIIFMGRSYKRRLDELHTASLELNRAQAIGRVGSWVYDVEGDRMQLSQEARRIFNLDEDARPGQLQDSERHPRTRLWRHAAVSGRGAAAQLSARRGHCGPSGRR